MWSAWRIFYAVLRIYMQADVEIYTNECSNLVLIFCSECGKIVSLDRGRQSLKKSVEK